MKILVAGARILEAGSFVESADAVSSETTVYPKSAMAGWKIVDVQYLPRGFDPEKYKYSETLGVVEPPPPPPIPPAEITMRQARLALLGAGKLAAVDAAIATMPEPNKTAAKIEWEYSNSVLRHNGFVSALGPMLGLTEAQIDALFIAGAKL